MCVENIEMVTNTRRTTRTLSVYFIYKMKMSRVGVNIEEFRIGWLNLLHSYSAIADLHTLQFTVTHASVLKSITVSTIRFLAGTLTVSLNVFFSCSHSCNSINSLPSLLNHLRLPSQETPSILILAGLGSSLYSLWADPTENTVSILIAQQYFDCCLRIRYRRNLFTECETTVKRLYAAGFDALVKRWDKCINVGRGNIREIIVFLSRFEYHMFYVLYLFVTYLLTLPCSAELNHEQWKPSLKTE
jgi:hypothetical protein